MKQLHSLRGTAKCPRCGGVGAPTEWLPGKGMDPAMRQFKCRGCTTLFYVVIQDNDRLLDIKLRLKSEAK